MTNPLSPMVSVVMAVFNGQEYLRASLDSLCSQTFDNFELIVVDDASSDNTSKILREFNGRLPHFHVITNSKNAGLPASLNRGIACAKGKYIARLDHDDVCMPERLAVQVRYMEENPSCVLLGTAATRINAGGQMLGEVVLPEKEAEIRAMCFFENPFIHPSVIIRSDVFDKFKLSYDEKFETTQDWRLWIDIMAIGRVANLPVPLIQQRVHKNSISSKKKEKQIFNSVLVQENYARNLFDKREFDRNLFETINRAFLCGRDEAEIKGYDRVEVCNKVLEFYEKNSFFVESEIRKYFFIRVVCRCIVFGLMPPFRRGQLSLAFNLFCLNPVVFFKELFKYIRSR